MEYKLIKIDQENESILISVDDVEMWVDYRKNEEGFFEWEFNKFVFLRWKKSDMEIQEKQETILDKELEEFDFFMDGIFYDYLEN